MKPFLQSNTIKSLSIALTLFAMVFCGNKSLAQIINTFPGSTKAGFNQQYGVAADDTDNIYVADWNSLRIMKITPAGVPTKFDSLNGPVGVVFDNKKNLYSTLYNNGLIVRMTPDKKIDTIAKGISGPEGIAIDPSDTILYATDWNKNMVYSISIATGKVDTIANKSGTGGSAGDNGPATAATLGGTFGNTLEELAVDAYHNIYVCDPGSNRVRVIAGTSSSRHPVVGYIYAFAGTGIAGSTGDGSAATAATLSFPTGVRVDASGNVYIADNKNNKIRVVDTAGIIHTIAGTGIAGSTGDGVPAISATFNVPYGLGFDKNDNLFISEQGANKIRVIATGTCASPVITSFPSAKSACLNATNVSLNVSTTGSAPLSFAWKKNGTAIGTNDSTYNISKVSFSDSGKYSVVVNNFCGSTSTATSAVLTVNPLPVVTITTSVDTVCEGIQVPMTASGAPDNYVWSPVNTLSNSTGGSVIATPIGSPTYTVIGTDGNGCTASATKELVTEICTGLTTVAEDEVSIYPNPASGLFTVKLSGALLNSKLELFTITGQRIYEEYTGSNYQHTFDMAKYSSSVYILQITSGTGIVRKKVVVE